MLLSLIEDGKNITVFFHLNTDRKDTNALLSELINNKYEEISSVPNDIVIHLIKRINSTNNSLSFIYESLTPYWFFHDLAHAIYTPDLFTPKIVDIFPNKEELCYLKGIELARRAKLPEEYFINVQEINTLV